MNVSKSVSKNGKTLKTVFASLLFLSSLNLIGCGRNSSANPGYGPAPTGVRSTSVVTRGTYVNGRYVEGGAAGGAGGFGGEDDGAVCSIQNLDAALQSCPMSPRRAASVKHLLAQSANEEGLVRTEVFSQLRLNERSTQCLGRALCGGGDAGPAGDVQDDESVRDIKPVPDNTVRRKF